jgi:hypothetical protein
MVDGSLPDSEIWREASIAGARSLPRRVVRNRTRAVVSEGTERIAVGGHIPSTLEDLADNLIFRHARSDSSHLSCGREFSTPRLA